MTHNSGAPIFSGILGILISRMTLIYVPYVETECREIGDFICVFNGQVRLGGSVRNYFLYAQLWIRLAVVSYRGEKVRTVVSPAVRSVNKPGDTRNFVQNGPEYAICVIFITRLYYKALGVILCALIWQIRHDSNRLDDGHSDVTGYRKMSALGTTGAMVTTHENPVMMWSFEGAKLFSVL